MNDLNQFRLIAIRVTSIESVGKRKLIPNKYYYFYQGYSIKESKIIVDKTLFAPIELYNGYFNNLKKKTPAISFSAIVGENGSGKSSIIEFALRLINNFAATTIGEYKVNPSTTHLHFVDGVFGELFYVISNIYYRLKIEGRNVMIDEYSISDKIGDIEEHLRNSTAIFDNEESNHAEKTPFKEWKEREKTLKDYYCHFFYTFVSNFSIYAYNTLDFHDECNSLKYEHKIRGNKKNYSIDDRCWLNSIFHKNDGYQTPIVLTPFRREGNIDIDTENKLAKERLISLMIRSDSGFRVINGHLEAQSFVLTKKDITYDASFLKENVGFKRLQTRGYERFEKLITKYWSEVLGEDLTEFKDQRTFYAEAIGYLTYKTLKISSNYRQYNSFIKRHNGIHYKIDERFLFGLISDLSKDSSHITKKIRQILIYIIYGIYDIKEDNGGVSLDIKSITSKAAQLLMHNIVDDSNIFLWDIDDFVPPPIFESKINLIDTKTKDKVVFETLSSGERQQAYSISSLLYHLVNLNSVKKDRNKKRIEYKYINIVLEEIELYFHPDLQRNFVKYLLDGIQQVDLSNIEAINICIVTHSPFILSDIPTNNILLLDKNANSNDCSNILKTFGANIHDMLKSSFFLDEGSIGGYVQWLINRIAVVLHILNEIKKENNTTKIEKSFFEDFFSEEKKKYAFLHEFIIDESSFDKSGFESVYNSDFIHQLIMLFDEPIIKNALLEEYYKVFEMDNKEKRILELKQKLRDLGEDI